MVAGVASDVIEAPYRHDTAMSWIRAP